MTWNETNTVEWKMVPNTSSATDPQVVYVYVSPSKPKEDFKIWWDHYLTFNLPKQKKKLSDKKLRRMMQRRK